MTSRAERKRWGASVCLAIALSFGSADAARGATILFEDDFDSGTWKPEWVSKGAAQWVVDGVLHTKDTDGGPRDSMAVVHDSDPTWTDYTVSLSAGFVPGTQWDHFNILLRTDDFLRNSENNTTGSAYQLEFYGTTGFGDPQNPTPRVVLHRSDGNLEVVLFNEYWPLTLDPLVDIVVELSGGNIRLWIDSQPVFDVTDPDPLPYGGVGIHAIWEAEAQFDDLLVTPEPGSVVLVAFGLLGLAGGRRHGLRSGRGGAA